MGNVIRTREQRIFERQEMLNSIQSRIEFLDDLTKIWVNSINKIKDKNNTVETLIQEIDRLNSTRSPSETCIICCTNPINSIFIPCCHLCACVDCSINLKQCPICRREVLKTYRVFKC